MKTQPWAIFATVTTAKCSTGYNHDDSLEEDYTVPFLKSKFLIPLLRHIFYLLKPNIYKKCDFVSSVYGNKTGKYTFPCFSKDLYSLW